MSLTPSAQSDFSTQVQQFILTWTPRVAVGVIAGYYSLGVAYDIGLMAMIDKVTIYVLKSTAGYIGVGAIMPTVQWYSAWAVRTIAALGGGLLYDIGERAICAVYARWNKPQSVPVGSLKC